MNTEKMRRNLPCYALRFYGEPADKLTFQQKCFIAREKEKAEEKRIKAALLKYELPDNLTVKELENFLYLRACLYMNRKPKGDFEGDAKICADVMLRGGDIVDMRKAGANAYYCFCLSHHDLDPVMQNKVIDNHVPF